MGIAKPLHAQDHLVVLREVSGWWQGHPEARPRHDLPTLVAALKAAVAELEMHRQAAASAYGPGQEEGRKPVDLDLTVKQLIEAVLARIDKRTPLSAKEYQQWQQFLQVEMCAGIERYIAHICATAQSDAANDDPFRR